MKIIEKEYNALTGEETITEREETAQEKKLRLQVAEESSKIRIEAESKAAARKAIFNRLGLTEEEAKLLLS